jgi:iron complex outermembrane receptor protein
VSEYAEVGYKFTDQLKLDVGGRYTHDHKTGSTVLQGSLQGGIDLTTLTAPQEGAWSAFTPKATLEYTPTKDLLFYATVSRGYIGGGFESNSAGFAPGVQADGTSLTLAQAIAANIAVMQHPYSPEHATNYEIGAKTSWLDSRLVANIDIYREDFKDLQVNVLSVLNNVPISIAGNAGRTRSQGLDLELYGVPAPWLHLAATYSYSDDKYLTTDDAGTAGNHLPFTPAHALNLSAQGEWELPDDGGTVSAGGDVTFRSKVWGDGSNSDAPAVHDRTAIKGLLNGSIDFRTHDGRWDVRLWGRNLTDTRYGAPVSAYFPLAQLFGYDGTYLALMEWNPPRTYGVTATYHLH